MSKILYENIISEAIKETSIKLFGKVPEIKRIGDAKSPIHLNAFNVIMGIVGDIQGQIILNFREEAPEKIVSKLLGRELKNEEELTISGIAEFGNILAGNAVTDLFEENGGTIGITPPSIILGKDAMLSTNLHDISEYSMVFEDIGDILMYIAIKEKDTND